MRDVYLDPSTGDITTAPRLTASGSESVRQRLAIRLALWQGEYGLDRRVGVPYGSMLGRKGAIPLLTSALRQAASTCPGVASLSSFAFAVDADRHGSVTLEARTAAGEPVSMDAFQVSL